MGTCFSSPSTPLAPYEVESPRAGARSSAGWSGPVGGAGTGEGKPKRRKRSKRERTPAERDAADRDRAEREHSRSQTSKSSRNRSTKSAGHNSTTNTPRGRGGGETPSSINGGGNGHLDWKDGAAAVAASSANDLHAEETELDDWQRGMLDIMEEQSIQAYDMDLSMGPNLERRYSNSFISFPSQTAAGLLFDSPAGAPRSLRSTQRMLSGSPLPPEPNPTILVVDEHPSTRQIITKWMTSSKYTEISCASGLQAMDILMPAPGMPVHHVDVIICDVNVLVFDGQLLLDWVINNDVRIAGIPVIVLSSNLPSQGLERLIRRGAWDVLHKPLNRAVFLNALATVFNTRKQKLFIERLRQKGDEYKERFNRSKHHHKPQHHLIRRVSASQAHMHMSSAPSSPVVGLNSSAIGWPASPSVNHIGGSGVMQPIQVLLIETDPAVAALLREWVETPSVIVRHVTSVQEAVGILRESQKAAARAATTSPMPLPAMQRATSQGDTTHMQQRPSIFNGTHQTSLLTTLSPAGSLQNVHSATTGAGVTSISSLPPNLHPQLVLPPASLNSTPGTPLRSFRGVPFAMPSLASIHFGIELIVVGHDALIPPECLSDDLAALGVDEEAYGGTPQPTVDEADVDEDEESHLLSRRTVTVSPMGGLAASQLLVDLSLQPVLGKPRRLPVVVVCEEDGPSPVAMAVLKHVALTILNAPLSYGLVSKKVSILLDLIEQNRQSLLLARRAHIYKALVSSLSGDDDGGASRDAPPSPANMRRGGGTGYNSSAASSPAGGRRSVPVPFFPTVIGVNGTPLHMSPPPSNTNSPRMGGVSGSLLPYESGSLFRRSPSPEPLDATSLDGLGSSPPAPVFPASSNLAHPPLHTQLPSSLVLPPTSNTTPGQPVSSSGRPLVSSSRAARTESPASNRAVLRIRTTD